MQERELPRNPAQRQRWDDAMSRIQRAQVAWLCSRFQLAYVAMTRDLVDGDLVSSLLLPAILNANVAHLEDDPDGGRRHRSLDNAYPDELRRPANALSIAQFLDIPRETVRAKLTDMVAAGTLQRMGTGYVFPTAVLNSERFLPSLPRYLDALNDFVSGLGLIRAFGLEPASRLADPVWPFARAALRFSFAHMLREAVYVRALTSGMCLTTSYVLLTVCQAVSGQLRLAPDMPAGGGVLAALGPVFEPVRGSAVASRPGLPEETVRRHLKRLVAAGYLCHGPRGYDVALDVGTVPIWRTFQKRVQANARQLVWSLTTTGIVPAMS